MLLSGSNAVDSKEERMAQSKQRPRPTEIKVGSLVTGRTKNAQGSMIGIVEAMLPGDRAMVMAAIRKREDGYVVAPRLDEANLSELAAAEI